jgi:hypothetical protein
VSEIYEESSMAAKSKQKTSRSTPPVTGGSTPMFGHISTGTQKPGQSASMGRGGGKFAKGGSGHMSGKNKVKPAKPR